MDRFDSWDDFCNDVFDQCGKSGTILKTLYAAGGMFIIFVILSMLGFGPFAFITWLLGFLVTPIGWVVAAVLGAAAVPALRYLFSEKKVLQPILKRLTDAKPIYDRVVALFPYGSPDRSRLIDLLFKWVLEGGTPPDPGMTPPPDFQPSPVPA